MATLLSRSVDNSDLRDKTAHDKTVWQSIKTKSEAKLTQMEVVRLSWWQHWAELARYILPRRYRWLVVANRTDKGLPINGNIVDETGTIAARTLAAGLMSNLTSPTRPWFHVKVPVPELMEKQAVKAWCDETLRRMLVVMAKSNFYESMAAMYFDETVFGTAPVIIYEDPKTIIRLFNPCAGEYYVAVDGMLRVDTLYRKFVYTVDQMVSFFKKDNVSKDIYQKHKEGKAGAQMEYVVAHGIEPNTPVELDDGSVTYPVPKKFMFREIYWLWGQDNDDKPLLMRGFNEQPFFVPRWDVTSNDPYGRSVGMDALPAIMQLQLEQKRKAEGIEKQVRPPLLADVSLKNEPTSSVAGGITYVANLSSAQGMKPVYEVKPDLTAMTADIKELQERIKNIFFNDLFLMISQLDTVRTATEIDARKDEKITLLGPVVNRTISEGLDLAVKRIFAIMHRAGLLPAAPPEIQGMNILIEYISSLAETQRSADTAAIERLFQFAGNLAGVAPTIMDNLDADEAIDNYGELLHVPAKIIKDKDQVVQMRAARAKQQQQAELLQQTIAGAKGAKDLSETNVGGGQNALQMMTGLQ